MSAWVVDTVVCYSLSCSWGQKLSNYTFGQELSANSSMQQVANWWKPCKERISNELAELLTSWSGNMLKIHLGPVFGIVA